jgi:predicted SnoaL-like aldol condensation-catalyzing enzyme
MLPKLFPPEVLVMSAPQTQSVLEHNKALLVRWFDEVWNQGRRATIHELLATDCVLYDGNEEIRGPDEFMKFHDGLRAEFSQFSIQPIQQLAEGDLSCMHWSVDCVHTATGRKIHLTGTSIVRVQDGQFVEGWQNWDKAAMNAQLLAG